MAFKVIATDFDGTLCEDKYPKIGEPNYELLNYLKYKQQNGAKIILWTCRAGNYLEEAINWCRRQGLCFDAINQNIPEAVEKYGEETRKVFAHEYIDDRANTRFILPYRKLKGE